MSNRLKRLFCLHTFRKPFTFIWRSTLSQILQFHSPLLFGRGLCLWKISIFICHHCWHLLHDCCQLRKIVIHALHQLLSSVSLSCYCCIQFIQSIRHGAHRCLQGGSFLFYLTVRVRKAGPHHSVMLPVIVGKSHHSPCSCCLVSPLFHISCVFLDHLQFLCALQNFTKKRFLSSSYIFCWMVQSKSPSKNWSRRSLSFSSSVFPESAKSPR